jgi:hypothetical protein
MANIHTKVSQRFLFTFGIVLVSLYALVWLIYGISYAIADESLRSHYGQFIKVHPCGSYVDGKEDLNQISINTTRVPWYILPLFTTSGFTYDIYYNKHNQDWEAIGTVNMYGRINEGNDVQSLCQIG